LQYSIPGYGEIEIRTIILDLNGTLSVGGEVVEGTHKRLKQLKSAGFKLVLFTGNTRGDADQLASSLSIKWLQAKNTEELHSATNMSNIGG
jgi:ribonucleotide monophosphatase NagD (HAD superfamily)